MNSPYMDTICTISAKELYEKVLEQEIPYHLWHSWIQQKLNARYIEILYKKNHRQVQDHFIKPLY